MKISAPFSIACIALAWTPSAQAQDVKQLFVSPGGSISVNMEEPDISGDGRIVTFTSVEALVTEDTNLTNDVYAYDTQTGALELVSIASDGTVGNGGSANSRTTADGNLVVFESGASNLVVGDTNGSLDVFVRDRSLGTTVRYSLDSNQQQIDLGGKSPDISRSGNFVAFQSAGLLLPDEVVNAQHIYRIELANLDLVRASNTVAGAPPNGDCLDPSISANGSVVAFRSQVAGLVLGDNQPDWDAFRFEVNSASTELAPTGNGSDPTGEVFQTIISGNGRYLAFDSDSDNYVAGDSEQRRDVFVFDSVSQTVSRVSQNSNGAGGDGDSFLGDISRFGNRVAFHSFAENLAPGDNNNIFDCFLYDFASNSQRVMSMTMDNQFAALGGSEPRVSDSAEFVAFRTAENHSPDDTGIGVDIYRARPSGGQATTYCTAKVNSQGCSPAISANGNPSLTLASPYLVEASDVLNNKNGLFFYGLVGAGELPFLGGTLCFMPPTRRTPIQFSAGNPPPNDCTGTFAFDFNDWIQSGSEPFASVGSQVLGQYWSRDPGDPQGVNLSNAVQFIVCP